MPSVCCSDCCSDCTVQFYDDYEIEPECPEYWEAKSLRSTGTDGINPTLKDYELKMKTSGAVMKVLCHAPGDMSKRRRERVLSNSTDWMNPSTVYSINKQKRWEVNLDELVEENQELGIEVMAVEKANQHKWNHNVNSVRLYDRDAEVVRCGRVKGAGTIAENIIKDKFCNGEKKEDMAVAGLIKKDAPYMVYEVLYPHQNKLILVGNTESWCRSGLRRGRWYWWGKNRGDKTRQRNKKVDLSEMLPILPENEIHSEEEFSEEYRVDWKEKFTLFDYLTAQNSEFVKVQNPKRRKETKRRISEQKSNEPAPFPVLDYAESSKTPCQFEFNEIDTSLWKEGTFEKQMITVFDAYPCCWLDTCHTRAIIYPTDKMEPIGAFPAWKDTVIVFEKKQNSVRMLYNSMHVLKTKSIVGFKDGNGDPDLIRIVCRLIRHIHEQMEYLKNSPKPKIRQDHRIRRRKKTVMDIPLTWTDYQPGIHASLLTDQIIPLEYPTTSEAKHAQPSTSEASKECSQCSTNDGLFEMRDHFSCRACLKEQVMHQVKMMHVPLHINFPNIEGTTDLDFISSILPVTLVRCYVKQALIPSHRKNVVVLQCPQCGSLSTEVEPTTTPYHTANCWHCKCVWCTKCAMEPHWPLNCEEHKRWKIKWDKQYLCRNPRKDISEGSNLLFVRCSCGGENRVIDDWTHANCVGCRKHFDPSTIWEDHGEKAYGYIDFQVKPKESRNVIKNGKDFRSLSCQKKKVQVYICSKYSKFCVEARSRRLNEDVQSSFRAKLRSLAPNSKELSDLRMAVLHLVEYGMALLSQQRDQPKGLRRKLKRMYDLQGDVEEVILRGEGATDSTLQYRILELKQIFNAVVDLFKQWQ